MKNAVLWDVTLCSSCKNRRSSETSVITRAKRRKISEDGILYKKLVGTSQETDYVSATKPSRLMLCKI
jgi:hypothetical protein